jgi:tetratricopeptide (TPR) repeat protein
MTSLTLSKASINYHSGRFKHTADEIDNAIEELKDEIPDATMQHVKRIFAALPLLAFKADKSMCTFRSCISSPTSSSTTDETTLLETLSMARNDNAHYLMALQGCICSMDLTSNQSHNDAAGRGITPDNGVRGLLMDRDRLHIAMAVIMAAISNSWLHLQLIPGESQDNMKASTKIKTGISLAACCFIAQNPKCFRPTWMEGLNIIHRAQARAKHNQLYASEARRMSVALRHLNHALTLVDLSMAFMSSTHNQVTHTKDSSKKRQREHENAMAEKRLKSTKENKNSGNDEFSGNDDSKLAMQEHLVKALQCHLLDSKHDRDTSMQMAMDVEGSGVAGKLKVLFKALDFLDLDMEDASRTIDCSADFIQSLSSLSATSTSMSFLLGCVYAKMESYDKALASFESAMKLYKHSKDANHSDYKNLVHNTAHCCIQKGDIDVTLEVLLHWIDIENSASNNTIENTNSVQPCRLFIDNDKQSQTSKLLNVLYRTFFAASLMNDWETCQSAIDALAKLSTDGIILLAKKFVDLKRLDSNKGCYVQQEQEQEQEQYGESVYTLGKSLYEAESRLLRLGRRSPTASSTGEAGTDEEHNMPKEMEQLLHSLWTKIKGDLLPPLRCKIESCIYNNIGVLTMSNGKPMEAIPHFLQAIKSLPNNNLLPVYNLSLALWSQGSKQEACRVYMDERGRASNTLSVLQEEEKESLSLDLEKAQIDLADVKDRKPEDRTAKDFLAMDICMMKYLIENNCA